MYLSHYNQVGILNESFLTPCGHYNTWLFVHSTVLSVYNQIWNNIAGMTPSVIVTPMWNISQPPYLCHCPVSLSVGKVVYKHHKQLKPGHLHSTTY